MSSASIARSALFQAIVELAGDPILVSDADGRVAYANPALTRAVGWSEAEFVGRYLRKLVHPEDSRRLEQTCAAPGSPRARNTLPLPLREWHLAGLRTEDDGSTSPSRGREAGV